MKKLIILTCVLFAAALTIYAQQNLKLHPEVDADFIQAGSDEKTGNHFVTGLDSQQSCTIIYASDGRAALAGNNEDYKSPFGTIWFQPAKDGKFGYMCFGYQDGWPKMEGFQWEGALNEKGLFYDFATTEEVRVPRDPNKPDSWSLSRKIMEECSAVDESIQLFSEYNFKDGVWKGHYMIGDRLGNSAIIEPLAVIRRDRPYQIATNFLQSKTDPKTTTDPRYRLASELFEQSDTISLDLFRRILNAVHWEEYSGSMTVTLYSYICDLKKGDIYIYHFHNFEDVVKINLQDELKKGERFQSIVSLFPYETFASKRYLAQRIVDLLYERVLEKGVEGGAIALFNEIKRGNYNSYHLSVVEGHLNALGYELLENNKVKEAIEVFKYNVSEYPESANAYDSLGEAYMKNRDKEKAIESYRKSLELNPNNDNAKKMLEVLGQGMNAK